MRTALIIAALTLTACQAPPPALEAQISPASRAAGFPQLIPLGPLLVSAEELLPDDPGRIGRSLEWRAADLRRRAALLRQLPLN